MGVFERIGGWFGREEEIQPPRPEVSTNAEEACKQLQVLGAAILRISMGSPYTSLYTYKELSYRHRPHVENYLKGYGNYE